MVIYVLGFVNYLKAIFCCSHQTLSDFYQFYQTFLIFSEYFPEFKVILWCFLLNWTYFIEIYLFYAYSLRQKIIKHNKNDKIMISWRKSLSFQLSFPPTKKLKGLSLSSPSFTFSFLTKLLILCIIPFSKRSDRLCFVKD